MIYSIAVIIGAISAVIVHLTNVFGKSVDRGSDLSSHVHRVFGVRETLLQIFDFVVIIVIVIFVSIIIWRLRNVLLIKLPFSSSGS